jgi:hypothetical protein
LASQVVQLIRIDKAMMAVITESIIISFYIIHIDIVVNCNDGGEEQLLFPVAKESGN